MSKDEERCIATQRVWDCPSEPPFPAVIVPCSDCGQQCWLAKTSLDAAKSIKVLCLQCVAAIEDPSLVVDASEETLDEARKHWFPNATREELLRLGNLKLIRAMLQHRKRKGAS